MTVTATRTKATASVANDPEQPPQPELPVNMPACFALAALIRYALLASNIAVYIQNRVEVSTPLNSWKRVQEGAFLYRSGINPYTGDTYHENPLVLVASNAMLVHCPDLIPAIYIAIDLLCAFLLRSAARRFTQEMHNAERVAVLRGIYQRDTEPIRVSAADCLDIPNMMALVYLFNPYAILSCVGLTTTVYSNALLAAVFWSLSRRNTLFTCLALALETQRNFYPFVLIVPCALLLSQGSRHRVLRAVQIFHAYALLLALLNVAGFCIIKNWSFLYSTYGFIFNHDDLQPNIGVFWYFFTEMFDHFRELFLYTFQLNATVLYLLPLSVRMHRQPLLLATALCAITTVFRSYPCVGDIAFYAALFPLWRRCARYTTNTFIVLCIFVIASVLGPTVWYLWVHCNSANANFYFGATLGLSTAQIFWITDLLFASNKRDFCLRNGLAAVYQMELH